MTTSRPAAALACLALACCVPPAPEPTPAPPAAPAARATPQTVPSTPVTLPATNWIDNPQTAGDWHYREVSGGSEAQFRSGSQAPLFALACSRASRQVQLIRHVSGAAPTPMAIRSEEATRLLSAQPASGGSPIAVALQATDPLLDAMAFTRGRFAVEAQGSAPLYLPSWPEVSRVIEDCR